MGQRSGEVTQATARGRKRDYYYFDYYPDNCEDCFEVCTANSLPYVVYCSWPDYCCGHKCCSHDMTIIKVIALIIFALILMKTWSYFSNRKTDQRTSLVSVIDVPMREVPPPPSAIKVEDPPPAYDLAVLLPLSRDLAPVSNLTRQKNLDKA